MELKAKTKRVNKIFERRKETQRNQRNELLVRPTSCKGLVTWCWNYYSDRYIWHRVSRQPSKFINMYCIQLVKIGLLQSNTLAWDACNAAKAAKCSHVYTLWAALTAFLFFLPIQEIGNVSHYIKNIEDNWIFSLPLLWTILFLKLLKHLPKLWINK